MAKMKKNSEADKRRWTYGGQSISVSQEDEFYRPPLDKGTYICSLRFCAHLGYSILVDSEVRMMPPFDKIQDTPLTEEEWNWVRDPKQYSTTPRFEKAFINTYKRFKKRLAVKTMGVLYREHSVKLDENDQIFLIVYVENVDSTELLKQWDKKFMWRKLDVVENLNLLLFCNTMSEKHKQSLADSTKEIKALTDKGYASDEIQRISFDTVLEELGKHDMIWTYMKWITLVIQWSMRQNTTSNNESLNDCFQLNDQVRSRILNDRVESLWEDETFIIHNYQTPAKRRKKVSIRRSMVLTDYKPDSVVEAIPINYDEPATYDYIDSSFEELLCMEELISNPTPLEVCQQLAWEFVEFSLITAIDHKDVQAVVQVVDELVNVVSAVEEMVYDVNLIFSEEMALKTIRDESSNFKTLLMDANVFLDDTELTYDDRIRETISDFHRSIGNAMNILTIASSVQDVVELVEHIESYEQALDTRISVDTMIQDMNENENLEEKEFFEAIENDSSPVIDNEFISHVLTETIEQELSRHEKLQSIASKKVSRLHDHYAKMRNDRLKNSST